MLNFVARMLASALFMFIIFFKFKDLDIDPSNKYHIYPTTCFHLVENLLSAEENVYEIWEKLEKGSQ